MVRSATELADPELSLPLEDGLQVESLLPLLLDGADHLHDLEGVEAGVLVRAAVVGIAVAVRVGGHGEVEGDGGEGRGVFGHGGRVLIL